MAVGAIAAVLMILWHLYLVSKGIYWLRRDLSYLVVFGTVARIQYRTTGAIIGAWVVLALSGRMRVQPHWLDQIGSVVAVGWVGLAVLEQAWPTFWMR
jgi:hypothetical protein